MIKCLLTELGRAGQENSWLLVMVYGPREISSVWLEFYFALYILHLLEL